MTNTTLRRFLQNNTSIEFDERTNQLIVVTHESNLPLLERMIASLDIDVEPSTTSQMFYIKHAKAEEVEGLLQKVIQGQQKAKDKNSNTANQTDAKAPVAAPTSPTEALLNDALPPPPLIPGAPGSGGESADNLQFSEFITIVADERTNGIIVYGTKTDLRQISRLIDRLDVILAQVRIEVVIAEVSLTNNQVRGIDAFGLNIENGSNFTVTEAAVSAVGLKKYNIKDTSMELVVNKAESNSDVKILSAPLLMTTHNEEATINVSESRPIITGSTTSTSSLTSSSVDYRDIGIKLKVTPRIGSNGIVQMEIEQTIETIGADPAFIDENAQPIINKREATSVVSVSNNEIIVLAGLQQREKRNSEGRLAILSKIPVVGDLFKSNKEDYVRQELMIFIQPHVIYTEDDAFIDAQQTIEKLDTSEEVNDYFEKGYLRDPEEPEEEPATITTTPRYSRRK